MGKTDGWKVGTRVRLTSSRFARGFADGTVARVDGGIAQVEIDGGGEALVYEPLGRMRAVFRGIVIILDAVEVLDAREAA